MRPTNPGRNLGRGEFDSPASRILARSALSDLTIGAKASMVNRTHRVVRERARTLQASRNQLRSLLLPLLLCSTLMILVYSALWTLIDQYELIAPETPTASHRIFMLLLWFLPVSAALGAMAWFRRSRNQSERGATR